MHFFYLHVVWFTAWIVIGVEAYPYGLLTMIVSLEAIFLITFVMISQNRTDAKRQVVADLQEPPCENAICREKFPSCTAARQECASALLVPARQWARQSWMCVSGGSAAGRPDPVSTALGMVGLRVVAWCESDGTRTRDLWRDRSAVVTRASCAPVDFPPVRFGAVFTGTLPIRRRAEERLLGGEPPQPSGMPPA
jgi:Protein of unknown function (DUF1003)